MIPRIVVVGGGAGGLPLVTRLGQTLGRQGQAEVVLVDASPVHVWKPRFHEVATGAVSADLDAVDYRAHARNNHYRFEAGSLADVDTESRRITLAPLHDAHDRVVLPSRSLKYDWLVLAVGSRSNDFGTAGVAEHCLFLDSQQQAERLRERFLNACLHADFHGHPLSVAIVGGGATGVELAAELHHAVAMLRRYRHERLTREQLRVHLIEATPRILPALSERVSRAAHSRLEAMGVEVHAGTMVEQVDAEGFRTAAGERIDADLLVWAAGVRAPDFLARIPGLEVNRCNQVVVDPTLQARGQSRVLVIGDCAACTPPGREQPVPPRAQVAQQMARHLARYFPRLLDGRELPEFHYHDHGSLVSLSRYSSVGQFMGSLKGGSFFIEGWLARLMYVSLYRMHQAALYGWPRTLALLLAGRFNRLVRPHMKLH